MNRTNTGMIRPVLFTALLTGVVTASQAATINIPVTNPGAETGDLSGWTSSRQNWPIEDYAAVGNPLEAPEGTHYFELDLSVFPSDPLDFTNYFYPPTYSLSTGRFDLSAYNGILDDIFVAAWTRKSNFALVLEDWDTGATYEYEASQYLSINLVDASGNVFYGLGSGTWQPDAGWAWQDKNFSWWSQWDSRKDEIAAIDLELRIRISNWGSAYGTPDLNTIDSTTIDAAYYTWTGADGNSYSGLLSDFAGDQLPIIGFDGVELRVATVPVPAAFWLFGSGLVAMLGAARKKRVSA